MSRIHNFSAGPGVLPLDVLEQAKRDLIDHEGYGVGIEDRLTGAHETQRFDQFSYGVSDRGASIRVPHSFVNNGYKGYLEDRRPNSQGDPYAIASQVLKTVSEVESEISSAAA